MMKNFFLIDQVSLFLLFVIAVVGISVLSFSLKYLKGDLRYSKFLTYLILLISSASCMIVSNHIFLTIFFWGLSNFLLVKLMIHKSSWKAALESGLLAQKYFIVNFLLLSASLVLFAVSAQSYFIDQIIIYQHDIVYTYIAGILMIVAAMIQSSLWPFQPWLLSSLNSPTPVSAMMHAGLINGGGFLLIRFFPLLSKYSLFLNIIFIAGLVSVILGSIFKLLQHSVKRMLACSTMSQMGFMFMQYGLGFANAALAHILLHGFLKSYLFLRSASVVSEKRVTLHDTYTVSSAFVSLMIALASTIIFTLVAGHDSALSSTYIVILTVVFIASLQMSLTILRNDIPKNIMTTVFLVFSANALYALSVRILELCMNSVDLVVFQKLNIIHIAALIILLFIWTYMVATDYLEKYFLKYA